MLPGNVTAGQDLVNISNSAAGSLLWKRSPAVSLPSPLQLLLVLAGLLATYCLWEQLCLYLSRWQKGRSLVPGPSWALPLVGGVLAMVKDPYKFWEDQRKYNPVGYSWNSILGKYMVFCTDAELSRKVFSYNDPKILLMAVHPSGVDILGPNNLAFMHGPPHKAIRKSFLALFTRKALSTYVELQDAIIRTHLQRWLMSWAGQEREIRPFIRDMNAYTSQEVFAGAYLTDPVERANFSAAFSDMTQGFLALPICLPGSAVWRGKQGRIYIVQVLTIAAAKSKARMKEGQEPVCLMDFWAQRCIEEIAEAAEKGVPPPGHTSDKAMADTVMDFLFASQDASTASLVWIVVLMAEHPDVLAKVREEQHRLRPDLGATINGDVLAEMTYTRQVVREALRLRPPAPMVPQITQAPFELAPGYSAPKGSLLMPSIVAASMQGFEEPERFDPDRFGPERKEDLKFGRNFLTFGHGPHYCVGREYAVNHLVAFLALLSTSCDWTRRRTPASDTWQYLPTIYPGDSYITLKPRAANLQPLQPLANGHA